MTGTRAPAPPAHGYVALPEGWERVSACDPGPFVTDEVLLRPAGTLAHWRSYRKSTPHATRWMAALFAAGFCAGALVLLREAAAERRSRESYVSGRDATSRGSKP